MLRFVVRTIGAVLLAVAVVFAVGDIARSMASGTTRLAPFSQALGLLGASPSEGADAGENAPDETVPDGTGQGETGAGEGAPSWNRRLGEALRFSADWPASVVLGVLAFAVLAAGQPRRARRPRFSGQD